MARIALMALYRFTVSETNESFNIIFFSYLHSPKKMGYSYKDLNIGLYFQEIVAMKYR